MEEILIQKLHTYIRQNNPDLLLLLEEEHRVTAWLQEKVATVDAPDIESCMEQLTADLKPSKYNYVLAILEEEFPLTHQEFIQSGILTTEVINLINAAGPTWLQFDFQKSEEDRFLRYAITALIRDYLEN